MINNSKIDDATTLDSANWKAILGAFCHPRVITMLFYGFSAGIPILLIFSSLSLWLREAGVERSVVTYFSWAALGYSFKFAWAPLVDSMPLPILHRLLGRRRSWILLSQLMIMLSIVFMASSDPATSGLSFLAISAVLLGFSSATQDIVIDAYRIESANVKLQAMMSSSYIAGYRIGMVVAGAGALYLAQAMGSGAEFYSYDAWKNTYYIMALTMVVGIVTTLLIREPEGKNSIEISSVSSNLQILILFFVCVTVFILSYSLSSGQAENLKLQLSSLLGNKALTAVLVEFFRLVLGVIVSYVAARVMIGANLVSKTVVTQLYFDPVKDFFGRYGLAFSILLLCLIGCYRIADIVLGVISNVFYLDMGYTKIDIANGSKIFGLWMSIIGGFAGGLIAMRVGVVRVLLLGAVLAAVTNLMFIALANQGYSLVLFYSVIGIDSFSGGIASAAFVAFLSALTNIRFSAMQYAIFTSLMTLIPKVLGGYSGGMVDTVGYSQFFTITAIMGIPVIILILLVTRKLKL